VRAIRERLLKARIELQEDLHDGPYGLTVYATDPDGVRVELYQVGEKMPASAGAA
jgi:ureidoacrylate peracid hydrolase